MRYLLLSSEGSYDQIKEIKPSKKKKKSRLFFKLSILKISSQEYSFNLKVSVNSFFFYYYQIKPFMGHTTIKKTNSFL